MASGSDTQNSFPFYLSPQQQQVLLQALASGQNKDAPHRPTSSNPFDLSPTSIDASPEQQSAMFNDLQRSSYLDNYDVDFNADSSLDFDVSNMSNPFPDDGNASAKSDTPEGESPEKRARDEEEDGSVSPNDAKRRENGEKVPKKPGRKPLTSEPTNVSYTASSWKRTPRPGRELFLTIRCCECRSGRLRTAPPSAHSASARRST